MSMQIYDSLQDSFGELEDRRSEINRVHLLMDLVVITICAVLCGADDWEAVAEYGEAKREWLSSFLTLPKGIPSTTPFGVSFVHWMLRSSNVVFWVGCGV